MVRAILLFLLCVLVEPNDGNFPINCVRAGVAEQIHLAFRGSDAVTISWKTYGKYRVLGTVTVENDSSQPLVEYSTNQNFTTSNFSRIGNSSCYTPTRIIDVSWLHNVFVPVKPGLTYYYRINGSDCTNTSAIHSFTAPPIPNNSTPINVIIFGDLGNDKLPNRNASSKTIRALKEAKNNTDFFLLVGDISYADDSLIPPSHTYEGEWNLFQENMEVITADKVLMTVPGNHEVTCFQLGDKYCNKSFQEFRNFTAYLNRFRMPGNESSGFKNLWFSFNYGPAHFTIISTETDFPGAPSGPGTSLNGGNFQPNGSQIEWLHNDLTAAVKNRKNVPWIIVAGHRPFYGSAPNYSHPINRSADDNCGPCVDAFGQIFITYKVDFYFCGHVHWYERLFPVNASGQPLAKNYTNPQGPIHITTGAGGAPEGADILNKTGVAQASAIMRSSFGYTRLEIKNASYARLSFYDTVSRNITDSVDIFSPH